MLPAKIVRPFVGDNKNDAHDARAIWMAVRQRGVKTVTIKNEEQQVTFRTAHISGLRCLLTEYGEVMPQGRAGMQRGTDEPLERFSQRLPTMVVETLREHSEREA